MSDSTVSGYYVAASSSSITLANARDRLEEAARSTPAPPCFQGRGIVICAGGAFLPSAYVVVRLLREVGVRLSIELWHAGENEIPEWARRAFAPFDVTFRDIMAFYPDRPLDELRGWPIKPAALVKSKFREILLLDADCFPLRNPEFLFSSAEFKCMGALFWPDHNNCRMVRDATIWGLTGLSYKGDPEFESGVLMLDKQRCWRELCLAQWMNANSSFWYDHVNGDKDTFYIAWRKFASKYFLGPPCNRYGVTITRHFWIDGKSLVDHRTAASKYSLPTRKGPFKVYLAASKYRSTNKNIYDEVIQRFVVRDFRLHVRFLHELKNVHDCYEKA